MKYIVNKIYSSADKLSFIKNFEFKYFRIKLNLYILLSKVFLSLNILFNVGFSFNFILKPLKINNKRFIMLLVLIFDFSCSFL